MGCQRLSTHFCKWKGIMFVRWLQAVRSIRHHYIKYSNDCKQVDNQPWLTTVAKMLPWIIENMVHQTVGCWICWIFVNTVDHVHQIRMVSLDPELRKIFWVLVSSCPKNCVNFFFQIYSMAAVVHHSSICRSYSKYYKY